MNQKIDTQLRRLPWKALLLLVAAAWALAVPSADYNPDEGVNILHAQAIRDGQRPLIDFFYHQPPTYIYALAWLAPQSLDYVGARALSFAALLLTAWLVYVMIRAQWPGAVALRSTLLFLTIPLHVHSILALPNSLMVFFSYASIFCIVRGRRSWQWALSGLLLAVAVYLKPLALASGIGLGLALLLWRRYLQLAYYVLFFFSGLIGFGYAVNINSGGNFVALLGAQLQRFTKVTLLEKLQAFPPFAAEIARRGIDSMTGWNAYEHYRTFIPVESPWLVAAFVLLTLSLGGLYLARRDDREGKFFWWVHACVVASELFFSLFLWAPVWDHYMLQYLPGMTILAAYAIRWSERRPRAAAALDAVLLALLALTVLILATERVPYRQLQNLNLQGQRLVTFDPFINVVSGSRPGCGLSDPLNQYGESALVRITMVRRFQRFHIDEANVIDCLRNGGDKILLTRWSDWFISPAIQQTLDELPAERFVYPGRWPQNR